MTKEEKLAEAKVFGANVRARRQRLKLSVPLLTALLREAGCRITAERLEHVEEGLASVNAYELSLIAALFQVTVDELLYTDETPPVA